MENRDVAIRQMGQTFDDVENQLMALRMKASVFRETFDLIRRGGLPYDLSEDFIEGLSYYIEDFLAGLDQAHEAQAQANLTLGTTLLDLDGSLLPKAKG